MMLQHFYNVGLWTEEEKIRQPLLEKLKAIKTALDKELDIAEKENYQRTLADLDYLIAYFEGNPPTLLPANSSLWGGPPRAEQVKNAKPERSKKKTPRTKTSTKKPIYKGKTCASTVETPQEKTQLLDLTRSLARLHGTIFVGASEDKDLFHNAFMSVLERCNDDDVLGFINEEIANGTVSSRKFCYGWMYVLTNGETITDAQQKRRIRIRMRAAELGKTIAANLDKPYVIELTQALLPDTVNAEEVLKKLRDSSLGTEIKKFVRTASLQKRYEISKLALGLLPDNKEIFNSYRKDLFDSELDQATIEKLETLYSSVTNWAGGTSQPWPVAKANLLATMLNSLAPTTNWRGERPLIAPETEASRLRAAADLLTDVVDGIDPNGRQKLLLEQYAGDFHRQQGFAIPLSAPETITPHRVGNIILPTFHNIGQRTNDQKLKLSLIKTLQRFSKLLGPEASIANDSGFGKTASLTDDIEYVMANLKGNPKKKLPINSRLRNDSVSDVAANRSEAQGGLLQEAPANEVDSANQVGQKIEVVTDSSPSATSTTNIKKPFYRGKTFDQWLKSAELDRDYATQSAALEACAATMETDQERASLLKLTAKLARKHGSIVTGLDIVSDRYNSAFMSVLEVCDADQIFEFIKTEISEGTLESRHFCAAWLILFHADSLSAAVIRRERKKISRVQNRFNELTGPLVENVNKPGVILLIRYLIPNDSNETYRKQVKEFRNSAVGIKVKEFILTGTPQQRFSVLNMAFEYFVDDPEVLEAYERDLLDPSINDVYVELTGESKSWPVVRAETFQKLLSTLAVSERTNELMEISDINKANRLESGARLLVKVTEGILSEGDKRLLFALNWSGNGGGGIGMSGTTSDNNGWCY